MNREEMRLKLQSASDKLKDVFDRLSEYTKSYYDLKLHQIAAEANSEDYEKYFDDLCEISYQEFRDLVIEYYGIETEQVGRTSSFTMTTSFLKDVDCDDEFKYFVETLAWKVCSSPDVSYELAKVNDELLDHIDESIDEGFFTEEDVDNDIEEILDSIPDVEDSIKKLAAADEYINKFKSNQLSYWNDYVDMRKEYEELDAK